jgi:ATP-dependent protease Clp ATPase subunit
MRRDARDSALRCSFCGKSQEKAGKLISSPSDRPRAYICDECIAVCHSILEDDRQGARTVEIEMDPGDPAHAWVRHPQASDLLTAVERWIQKESLGVDASGEIAETREIAIQMMRR